VHKHPVHSEANTDSREGIHEHKQKPLDAPHTLSEGPDKAGNRSGDKNSKKYAALKLLGADEWTTDDNAIGQIGMRFTNSCRDFVILGDGHAQALREH
jgi:hypothetical protein